MMNKKVYKQYDSRWGNLPYPTRNSSFAGNGCGCVAVTHLAIENSKYKNLTPKDVRKFMVKYAVAGQGTAWNGIPAGLKHYGYANVKHIGGATSMTEAFKELNKGNRMGVILLSAGRGGSNRVLWTAGGHYVAFTSYKYKNGKHWFYTKDSGTRGHDGWYTYEGSMRGVISQMWIVEKIKPKKDVAHDKCIDSVCNFARKYANDNSYSYKKWTSDKKTHQCPICHPNSGKGWNCIGFVSACFYHGGGVKTVKCANDGLGNNAFFDKLTPDKWRARNGKEWIEVKNRKKGDILICYRDGKYKHTALYLGNGKIADATSSRGIKIRNYSELKNYKKRIFRYTGHGNKAVK